MKINEYFFMYKFIVWCLSACYENKLLQEGKVLPWFGQHTAHLLSPPLVMIKSWGALHGKMTTGLYEELLARGVDSRDKLLQALKSDPSYLRAAFLK